MDSDSSLDGEFETKHEIAVKSRRDTTDEPEPIRNESEEESGDSASDDGGLSPIRSPPLEEKGELSPKSNEGELSDSSNDAPSNASSGSSNKSDNILPSVNASVQDTISEISNLELENRDVRPSTPAEAEIESEKVSKKDEIPGHGEDLSDVSDLDSNDGRDSLDVVSDDDRKKKKDKEDKKEEIISVSVRKETAPVEEMEQLDFEAEEQQEKDEKEEGECEGKDDKSDDEGELKGEDLEEGELTDEDENRPEETEPRPVCRFYNRGQCTWGSSCRFVHPGVTDKGNYTMFDMVRPLVPVNGPPIYQPMDYRSPYEKPIQMGIPYQGPRKEEPPVFESAWERGLRQAKEMMRKSTKRKETDMDFEEKKMNLSLGQEELDKENDYYTRPASPILKEEPERWGLKLEADGKYHREGSATLEHFDELPESPYYHQSRGSDYWRRVHYEPGDSRALRVEAEYTSRERGSKYHSQPHQHRATPAEYYDKYDKKTSRQKATHPAREVIVERVEKPWRDERYAEVSLPSHRGRGDEWADPWMRSKSPTGRKVGASRPSRRQSYSSGSSYSSSSSSRSSSQSSYSSYSHDSRSRSPSKSRSPSRSLSRSSSRTRLSRARRKPNRPLVPTARAAETPPPPPPTASPRKTLKQLTDTRVFNKTKPLTATLIISEKKAASERALLMNPPAPSPRKQKEVRPPSPGMMRKSAQNPPPPIPNARTARSSKSSRSSSGSESSGSSSESSESSCSSSSSSREPSPKAVRPPKRIVIDERERIALAQSLKVKAMDALKLSGQKQQIKLTLKAPGSAPPPSKRTVTGLPELPELNLVRRERLLAPILAGKKRPAEISATAESALVAKVAALSKPIPKKATSRREELLKQLKAVEDAIARKRSKI